MYPNNNFINGFNYMNSPLPFNTPKIKTLERMTSKKALGTLKKFSLNSFLDTSTKAINTFNSFVPLYHEVKPLIENTKDIAGTFKKYFTKNKVNKNNAANHEVKEIIEPEIVESKQNKKEENILNTEFKEENEPNRPYFPLS